LFDSLCRVGKGAHGKKPRFAKRWASIHDRRVRRLWAFVSQRSKNVAATFSQRLQISEWDFLLVGQHLRNHDEKGASGQLLNRNNLIVEN
jgi:hypothetical protein